MMTPTLAPDFTLTDVRGHEISLSDYFGVRHVILVFNRGFTCPYCRQYMVRLAAVYDEIVARSAEILVIGPEERRLFARHWSHRGFPFPGLPDPTHEVSDQYGQLESRLSQERLPAVVIVDREGRVRFEHHGRSAGDVPDIDALLAVLNHLDAENA